MSGALLDKKEELDKLNKSYDRMQKKYGAKELDFICNGGKVDNPDINIKSTKNIIVYY